MKNKILAGLLGGVVALVGSTIDTNIIYSQDTRKESQQSPTLEEIKQLGLRMGILAALNQLNLKEDQLKSLHACTQKAQELRQRFQEEMLEIVRKQEKAFEKFRAEDIENKGFHPKTEQAAGELNHKGEVLYKNFCEAINEIEGEVLKTLDKEQATLIEEARLDNPEKLIERFLTKKPKFSDKKADKKDDPEKKISQIHKELGEIHKQKYGSIGPIGRFMVCEETLPILAKKMGTPSNEKKSETAVSGEIRGCEKEVRELREDINLLNLLNGMYFTEHQIQHLIKYVHKAEEIRGENPSLGQTLDPQLAQEAKEALEKAISHLEAKSEIPQELLRRIGELRRKIIAGIDKKGKPGRQMRKMDEIQTLALEISPLLFDNQKQTLIDYKACLIPPKNLKDPVRVGQANDTSHTINILRKLRTIPAEKLAQNKEDILERVLSNAEKHGGKYTEEQRETHRKRLAEILDEVHSMSDVDFEVSKEDIAQRLTFLDKAETLKEELKELIGDEEILKNKIMANLLHPRIAPLLEARYQQLKGEQSGKPIDLDKISPAPSCKNGKCAVKE